MNEAVRELREQCERMEANLHEINKNARIINRLLDHVDFEENLVEVEKIVFQGDTSEFVELIAPLLRSNKWRVNGTAKAKKFLRAIDEVFKIQNKKIQGFLKFDSLYSAVKEYFDRYFPDDPFS